MGYPKKKSSLPQGTFGRYQVRHKLGEGAHSTVYAAWDPKLGREVAIKVLLHQHARDAKLRGRFLREAKTIAGLSHPNIVKIYDYSGAQSEQLYLVIEKYDGDDLYAIANKYGPLPEGLVASMGYELCDALDAAHQQGVVHRDLKPENVMLTKKGQIVLTDFGIMKSVALDQQAVASFEDKTEIVGTPGFMAPELLKGRVSSISVDIFSLGVLLYNIATNRMPFEGLNHIEIFRSAKAGAYVDPREREPSITPEFAKLITDCLSAESKRRPPSALAVKRRLNQICEQVGVYNPRGLLQEFSQKAMHIHEHCQKLAIHHNAEHCKQACSQKKRNLAMDYLIRLKALAATGADLTQERAMLASYLEQVNLSWKQLESNPLQLWMMRWWIYPWMKGALITMGISSVGLLSLWKLQSTPQNQAAPIEKLIPVTNSQHPKKRIAQTRLPIAHAASSGLKVEAVTQGSIKIWLDGKPMGNVSDRTLLLSPGEHQLELHQNQRRVKIKIHAVDGKLTTVRANFLRRRAMIMPYEPLHSS